MSARIRYQVFVSSTQLDLRSERECVINELTKNGFIVAAMEQFPATDEEQMDYIKPIIDASDYYIVIVKGRYGSLNKDRISFTEAEFRYAKSVRKPCFAFIYGDRASLKFSDADDNIEKMQMLNNFIEELQKSRIVKHWINTQDLVSSTKDTLYAAVWQSPGIGWVRGDQVIDPKIINELEDLRRENALLKSRLDESEGVILPNNIAHGDDIFTFKYNYRKAEVSVDVNAPVKYLDGHIDGDYHLTWDELFKVFSDNIYNERSENQNAKLLEAKVRRTFDLQQKDEVKLQGDPVKVARFQFERLGLIKTIVGQTEIAVISQKLKSTFICWTFTDKGRAYLGNLMAIRRT